MISRAAGPRYQWLLWMLLLLLLLLRQRQQSVKMHVLRSTPRQGGRSALSPS
jgi:MYXO-CTERM domain-containing protein